MLVATVDIAFTFVPRMIVVLVVGCLNIPAQGTIIKIVPGLIPLIKGSL